MSVVVGWMSSSPPPFALEGLVRLNRPFEPEASMSGCGGRW